MKKTLYAIALLVSTVAFCQTKYYKDKNGNVLTQNEYNKVLGEFMDIAIKSKQEGEKLEVKNDLTLVKQTKDSAIYEFTLAVNIDITRSANTKKKG